MTVWQGVRKLNTSDASLMGLSSAPANNNGTIHILAPGNEASGSAPFQNYSVYVRGTQSAGVHAKTYVTPTTNVLSAALDISLSTIQTEALVKVNAQTPTIVVSGFGQSSAGTGNFGNYAAYFFAQGGTGNFLNGNDYGSIARGAASTAAQITAGETYINSKTKAY
jgi:hypothetical protein